MKKNDQPSSAEKRVLWEVRQRYNIDKAPPVRRSTKSSTTTTPHTSPAAPRTRPAIPPTQPPRKPPRGGRPRGAASGGKRGGKHWLRRSIIGLVLILLLSGGIFGYKILAAGNKISSADRSILGQLKDLLFSQGKTLEGEEQDRINILLTAIGGEGHSGQNLADTVMVASIRPQDNQVALLSIPRDLYVQVPGEQYYSKINAVHAYGESQKKGQGPETLATVVEEITGQPIHYYGRVDFEAFKQIVDAVGGINITIENSFFDYWHKISFSAGTEKMDGERALAYVRARYIEGPEGGDFKRAARQQQVLLALQEKVFSVNTALDFTALNSILNSLSNNIRTDMHLWEMKRFYELARQVDRTNVKSVVLSTGPNGVLVGTTEMLGGTPASVLKPRTGNYAEIHSITENIFAATETAAASSGPANVTVASKPQEEEPTPTPEPAPLPTIEIRNGTNITGLAKKTSEDLSAQGYEIVTIGNAASRDIQDTTVYALTDDATSGAKIVADKIDAQTDSGLPAEEPSSSADVLIILGQDAG